MLIKYIVVFAGLFLHASHSWMLEQSHTEVHVKYTTDVSIKCSPGNHSNNNDSSKISEVLAIVLRRRESINSNATFETIAKVRIGGDAELNTEFVDDVKVRGHAHLISDSFLTITWSLATEQTVGQYVCEVHGFASDDDVENVVTRIVSISDSPFDASDLMRLVMNIKSKSDQIGELAKSVNEDMDRIWKEMKKNVNNSNETNYRNETNDRNGTNYRNETMNVTSNSELKWPRGGYSLVEPASGCPMIDRTANGNTTWNNGYIKVHAESNGNGGRISDPNHLRAPIIVRNDNNFFFIRTCNHEPYYIDGPRWPSGSYCVHRFGGYCPEGFSSESYRLRLDPEDDSKLGTVENPADNNLEGTYQELYFCCHNDGSPSDPIKLPVETPFYLYRYGGKCQTVAGMIVSEEWYEIDTEDSDNGDKYVPEVGIYPDSSLNPFKAYLCYYRKKTSDQ